MVFRCTNDDAIEAKGNGDNVIGIGLGLARATGGSLLSSSVMGHAFGDGIIAMGEAAVGVAVGVRQGLKSATDGWPSTSSCPRHATEDGVMTIGVAKVGGSFAGLLMSFLVATCGGGHGQGKNLPSYCSHARGRDVILRGAPWT